jgi:4-hydroxybutyryl-CoA dehydratase/vinylacetyl-CoA-Delta-isomerase
MGPKSPKHYKESLRDGRVVFYKGKQIEDITKHPVLKIGIEQTSLDYKLSEDPDFKELMITIDAETGRTLSRYFKIPRTSDDLLRRRDMIETVTRVGRSIVALVKEIGTDALFTFHIVARAMDKKFGTYYLERVKKYHEYCQENDLAMAVAQTDVKGDRSLRPHEQSHPDYYVRVLKEKKDGIIVRGAKAHTTNAVFANEIIVIPTRAMTEEDKDYALAFAVPANSKGLKMVASSLGFESASEFHHPVSARHKMIESLTIFEDVFVPWDRVFMKGEWQFAGALAKTFVDFHRFTAISYKPPLCDLLIGAAALIAEYNGIEKASHVVDKIARIMMYTETVRGLSKASALNSKIIDSIAIPDPILTNTAKYYFANNYHEIVSYVQDIAGGLLVTGPSEEDYKNPETQKYLDKYLGGKSGIPTEHRLRIFNLIRDLTASNFGGYNEILAIHAEGSLEAQKITVYRDYDLERCKALAREAVNI